MTLDEFYEKHPEFREYKFELHYGHPVFIDKEGREISTDTIHPGRHWGLHSDLMDLTDELLRDTYDS